MSENTARSIATAPTSPFLKLLLRRKALLPIVPLIVVLAGWQYATTYGNVSKMILASPTAIVGALQTSGGEILMHAGVTLIEALSGFAIGNVVGLLLAILFIYSDLTRRTIYPVAVTVGTVPIVAVVSVLIIWLGNGMAPKIFITSFLSFVPMLINAGRGLKSADAEVNELLYTLSASARQRLLIVRLPASVPFLFAALKLSACTCVVTAIVGEWLAADYGLGHLIVHYGTIYDIPQVWATALISTAMSLCVYGTVVLAEHFAMPWRKTLGSTD